MKYSVLRTAPQFPLDSSIPCRAYIALTREVSGPHVPTRSLGIKNMSILTIIYLVSAPRDLRYVH